MTLGVTIASLCRARLVLFPTVDMDLILKAMKKTRPTILPAVPPVYRRLMDEAKKRGVSLEGIRYAVSGAMNLPPELVAEWEEASGGFMVEGYGLTECARWCPVTRLMTLAVPGLLVFRSPPPIFVGGPGDRCRCA